MEHHRVEVNLAVILLSSQIYFKFVLDSSIDLEKVFNSTRITIILFLASPLICLLLTSPLICLFLASPLNCLFLALPLICLFLALSLICLFSALP